MQQKHKTHQKPRWGKSQHLRGPKRKLVSPESCLEGVAWITSNDREAKVIEKLNIEAIEGRLGPSLTKLVKVVSCWKSSTTCGYGDQWKRCSMKPKI